MQAGARSRVKTEGTDLAASGGLVLHQAEDGRTRIACRLRAAVESHFEQAVSESKQLQEAKRTGNKKKDTPR